MIKTLLSRGASLSMTIDAKSYQSMIDQYGATRVDNAAVAARVRDGEFQTTPMHPLGVATDKNIWNVGSFTEALKGQLPNEPLALASTFKNVAAPLPEPVIQINSLNFKPPSSKA